MKTNLKIKITLAALCLAGFAFAPAAQAKTALINAATVTGGAFSTEALIAATQGYTVTVVSDATWGAMTAAQFGSYDLLIAGDPTCGPLPPGLIASAPVFGPVVMGHAGGRTRAGNRVLIGTDPIFHAPINPGAQTLITNAIVFAGKQPGTTGFYFDDSCSSEYYGQAANTLNILNTISAGSGAWTIDTNPPCGGNVSLIAFEPSFATLTTSNLSGWGCSVHESFPTFPTDWSPLAVATDTTSHPTCGTDPNTHSNACGEAYILIAGSSIVLLSGSISITPTNAINPVGTSHTVTAHVTSGGAPLTNQVVNFTVTGVNAGAGGTCSPGGCTTDTNGNVSFTYFDANGAGDDTIKASFTDATGSLQAATAQKHWIVVNNPPVAVCTNVTVSAGANCDASASIDGGSYDPDPGDTITLSQTPPGPYPLGTNIVTLNVTDNHGASNSCTATVTVVDTTPPVITGCPTNLTVYTGPGRATCDQVATWTPPTASDNCTSVSLTSDHQPGDTFPVGTTLVTYTARPDIGYRAAQVPVAFEEISSTGTRVLTSVDDGFVSASLGFPFNFYGTSQTTIYISSNGLLTFGSGNSQFGNVDFSTTVPGADQPSIAPLWDDWQTFQSGADAVYYKTLGSAPNRRFVVEWHVVDHYSSSPSPVTFEAKLFEGSNDILFRYLDVVTGDANNNGASATVGIRDTSGQSNGRNLQWSFNSPVITNGDAILFTPNPPPATNTATCSFTVTVVDTTPPVVTLNGSGGSGHIYVADYSGGTIGEYNLDGTPVNTALVSGLNGPFGLAVSGGQIYVANYGDGTIGEYNLDGTPVNAALISGLNLSSQLAVAGGQIYIANSGDGTIGEYNLDGTPVNAALVSGLNEPFGVAVSGSQIYVANYDDGTIGEYNLDGTPVNTALVSGLALDGPAELTVDGGHIYVANIGDGTIGEYNLDGTPVNTALISGLDYPYCLAVAGGHIYVANFYGGIGEYNFDGTPVNTVLVSGLINPLGIVVEADPLTVECHSAFTDPGATAHDACAGNLPVTTTGSVDPNTPGIYTLTYSATDPAGNTGSNTLTVTVQDTTPPVAPVLPTVTGQCSVTLTNPITTDTCAGIVTGTTSDPTNYTAQGTYTVHWTFDDGNSNSSTANQTVIVQDNTPPTITCPGNIVVTNNGTCSSVAVVAPPPTVSDNCPGVTLVCTRSDGQALTNLYPVGVTTITCTATDAHGNTASCSYTVTVTSDKSIASNFNGTAIPGNSTIWFSSVIKPSLRGACPVTVKVIHQTIKSAQFNLVVPDSEIHFVSGACPATTVYTNGLWVTTVGCNFTGNIFLSGLAYHVPAAGLPGGINPVTWSGTFITDQPGVTVNWIWAAALYTTFATNNNAIGVKPVDGNQCTSYNNSDHAGTPENDKPYVIGGTRGGGGSNWTGSLSGTLGVSPCDTLSASAASSPLALSIQVVNGNIVVTWEQGVLQGADEFTGPYADITGAISPYTVAPTAAKKLYRVRLQ